jgi:hypothetical protein
MGNCCSGRFSGRWLLTSEVVPLGRKPGVPPIRDRGVRRLRRPNGSLLCAQLRVGQFVNLQMATNLMVSPTAFGILAGAPDVKVNVCYKGSLSLFCFPFGTGRRVPATKLREDVKETQRTADYSLRFLSPGDYVISYFLNN